MNAHAVIGHNGGPQLSPYDAIKLHIDDLFETAQGFLDGEPIANQEQADAVGRLLAEARKARATAEEQRKAEAKPFDDGKAAVQALWTPLTDKEKGRCVLIEQTAKKALAPFLAAEDAKKRAEAEAKRKAAEEAAAAARKAIEQAREQDLAARERAEALIKVSEKASRDANRAEKDRPMAAGGARSVSLRSVWSAQVDDFGKLLAHYKATQPERLKVWLQSEADRDVKAGARALPGVTAIEEKVAV